MQMLIQVKLQSNVLKSFINAATIVGVTEKSECIGRFLHEYGDLFSEHFNAYHRLDLRFERQTDFWGL